MRQSDTKVRAKDGYTVTAAGLAARAERLTEGFFAGVGRGMGWSAALAGALVGSVCASAIAGPDGAQVVRGNVSITRQGAETLIRAGNNSIINYRSFNIARGETVRFLQPSATSRVLNRITGASPTRIDGNLFANGRVYMVNPAGVIFGQGSVVNVSGLYAAAGKLSDADFVRGIDRFTNLAGQVANYGTMTADFVAMAGATVANGGVIDAPQGTVVMAAGSDVLIGDRTGGVMVKVTGEAAGVAATGTGVENTGTVKAQRARMGAGDMYSLAVRNAGVVQAKDIRIEAKGEVRVSGTLDASSQTGKGGEVRVLGDRVGLTGATIDASGATGGGKVLIGGNFQGQGPEANAQQVYVSRDSSIDVSATQRGNAGQAVIWSDVTTRYYGDIHATGGAQGGNGGQVEVSGKQNLGFDGKVDTTAAHGKTGTLLLDPSIINIANAGTDDAQVADGQVNFADGGAGTFVISPTAINAVGATVTLQATSQINVNNAVSLTTAGAGLILQSQGLIALSANITTTNGAITLTATGTTITLGNNVDLNAGTAAVTLDSPGTITIDNGSDITGGVVSITSGGNILENGNINGSTSITLAAGTDGTGDLTFPTNNRILNSPSISLRAGDGSGGTNTAIVESGNTNISYQGTGAGTAPTTFSIRQDANIANADIPVIAQFGAAVSNISSYTITSDAGTVTLSTASKVAGAGLSLNGTGIVLSTDIAPASLTTGTGTVTLGGNVTTAGGQVVFGGPVNLSGGARTIDTTNAGGTAAGASITFSSTTNGAQDLTLDAGTAGNIFLTGATGGSTPLSAFTILNAHDVTAGAISAASITLTASNGAANFGLLTTTGASGISLTGTAIGLASGATTTGTGTMTVVNSGTLNIAGALSLDGAFSQSGGGGVNLGASISTTNDDITLAGAATMTATPISLTAGTGTVTVAAVNTGSGVFNITADEIVFTGAANSINGTGTVNLLNSTAARAINIENGTAGLDFTAAEMLAFAATLTQLNIGGASSGAFTIAGATTFNPATTLTTGAGFSTTVAGGLTAGALTVSAADAVNFDANVTASTSLNVRSGTDGSGNITFNNIVVDTPSVTLRAGNGAGSTAFVDAGNNTPTFQNGVGVNPTTFSLRQDATINEGTLPQAFQFGAGDATGVIYALQSDGGNIALTLAIDPTRLDNCTLTLTTSGANQSQINSDLSVTSLTVNGITRLGANVTTPGGIVNFGGAVVLFAASQTVDTTNGGANAAGANIIFGSTVQGTSASSHSLTVRAGTGGDVTHTGNVGTTTQLAGYTITSAHDWSAPIVTCTTFTQTAGSGTTTFSGRLTANAAGGISLTGTAFTFSGGVDTASGGGMSVNSSGLLTIATGASQRLALDGAFAKTGAGNTSLGADISTTNDNISFSGSAGTVTLGAAISLTAGTGTASLGTTVIGANNLTITANGIDFLGGANSITGTGAATLTLQGATAATTIGLGGGAGTLQIDATDLAALADEAAGSIVIGNAAGTAAITSAAATFRDAVTLRATGVGGSIVTTGTLTGATSDATVTLQAPLIALGGDIVTAGAAIAVGTTSTHLARLDATVLLDTTNAGATAAGASITFAGTVNALAAGTQGLTVRAGTGGNVTHTGAVGDSAGLGAYTITSTNNFNAAAMTVASLTQTAGSGTSTFTGLLTANGSPGDINLTGAAFSFTGGVTTLNGGIFTVANSGLLTVSTVAFNLDGAFSQTGAGNTSLGANISTSNDNISFNTGTTLTLAGATTLTAGTGTVTLRTTALAGNNLTIAADGIDFLGGANSITGNGSGTITLKGATNATTIGVIDAGSTLNLDATDLAALADEATGTILFGGAGVSGDITVGSNVAFRDAVSLQTTGTVSLGGAITGSNADSSVTVNGGAVTLAADITTAGALISITGTTTLTNDSSLDTTNAGAAAAGANITLASAVNADIAGSHTLDLTSGTAGDISVAAIGTGTRVGAFEVLGAHDVSTQAITVGFINNTVSGTATYNGALNTNLASGITLSGTGNHDVASGATTTATGGFLANNTGTLTVGAAGLNLDGPFTRDGGVTNLGGNITTTNDSVTFTDTDDDITLTGASVITAGTGTVLFGGSVAMGGNALTVFADGIDFTAGNNTVTGAGTAILQLAGGSNATTIGLAGGAGTLQLSQAALDAIATGAVSEIDIGRATGTGNITVPAGGVTFNNNVRFLGSTAVLVLNGPVNAPGSGCLTFDLAVNLATDLTASCIVFNGALTITGAGVDLSVGSGSIDFNSTVDIGAFGFTALGDDINFGGGADSVTGTGAGAITLTTGTANNIRLATTGTGLVISGTDLAALADNFGTLQVGRATDANTITLGAASYRDPVNVATSNSGSIVIGANQTGTGNANFSFVGPTSLGANITTANGNVVFDGATTLTAASTVNVGTGILEFGNTLAIAGNNLTLVGNEIDFTGGADSVTGNGSGTLSFEGATTGTTIGIGGGAGTLQIDTTDLAALADEAAGTIVFGNASGNADITVNTATFRDAVIIRNPVANAIIVNGDIIGATADASITLNTTFLALGANITTAGAAIQLNAAQTRLASNVALDTTNAGAVTAGANIGASGTVFSTDGSQGLTLTSGTAGDITLGGFVGSPLFVSNLTVVGAHDLTTQGISAGSISITLSGTGTFAGLITANASPGIGLHGTGAYILNAGAATLNGTNFTADNTGLLTINNTALALSGTFTRTGDTNLGAGIATEGGTITFNGDVTLTGDLALSTVANANAAGANVLFGGLLLSDASANGRDLSVDAGTGGSVTFSGNVGSVGQALGSLTVTASNATPSIFLGQVITTGFQSYTGSASVGGDLTSTTSGDILFANNVLLTADVTMTTSGAAGDDISIGGSVTSDASARALTLGGAGNLGNVSIIGSAGAPNALASLTAVGATISTGSVTTVGTQSYTGNLDAGGTLSGTTIAVSGNLLLTDDLTVNASTSFSVGGTTNSETSEFNDLTVNSALNTFTGAVGTATNGALGSITTDAGGSTTIAGGQVVTQGAQSWGEDLTLTADTTFASTGGGGIDFTGTVNTDATPHALTVNTSGAVVFAQTVGNSGVFSTITTDATGTTRFNANVSANGNITINDDALIGGTVLVNGGNIAFNGLVDSFGSVRNLTLNGTGAVTLGGTVGGTTHLNTLSVTGTSISLRSVTTDGTQNYSGPAVLNGDLAATTAANILFTSTLGLTGNSTITSAGGNISFSDRVDSVTSPFSLAVNAGAGDVLFSAETGTGVAANLTRLASLSVTGDAITLRRVRTDGQQSYTGTAISLNGDLTALVTGPIALTGDVTLLQDTSITTNNGDVQFGGKVNSDGTSRALAVNAGGSSQVLFSSGVGVESILSTLSVAGGSAKFNITDSAQQAVRTTGDQTYNAAVLLASDMTLSGNDITFGGTVNSDTGVNKALAINTATVSGDTGETTFTSAVGGVRALSVLTTNTEGTTKIGADITTTSGMTFGDQVRLTGDSVIDGGAGALFFRSTIETDAGATNDANLTLLTSLNADADTIPIKLGGNIGVGRRLASLTLGADRSSPQRGATAVMSDGFDASGVISGSSFAITDSYTINTGTGGFTMGRGQKLTALGKLNILTQGIVTVGDLTALGDMTVRGTAIRLKLRGPGTVFDNIFQTPTDQLDPDAGLDIVAAGEIALVNLSNAPIIPTQIPFAGALDATFSTNSGNRPVNLTGFNFLKFTDTRGVLSVAFFTDPRTGNGGRLLGLDIAAKGPPVDNVATSIAGAIPRDTESRENAPPVTISAALREPLQEMGISVRDLEFTDLVEFLIGRAMYRDLPGKPSPKAEDLRVTVNRLSAEPVQALITSYRALLYKQVTGADGKTELVPNQDAVRTTLEDAWNLYADQAGDKASGGGFAAWLKTRGAGATPAEVEAARILDGIRDVLAKVDALGLSPAEARIPRDRILGDVKPQSMTDDQMLEAVMGEATVAMR